MKKVSEYSTKPYMPIPQPRTVQPTSQLEPSMAKAAMVAIWQSISRKWIAVAFVTIGIVLGLIYGWVIDPVEWTGGTYEHLTLEDKALLIQVATDLNVYDATNPALAELQRRWPEIDELACFVATHGNVNESEKIELVYLAKQVNQRGCE